MKLDALQIKGTIFFAMNNMKESLAEEYRLNDDLDYNEEEVFGKCYSAGIGAGDAIGMLHPEASQAVSDLEPQIRQQAINISDDLALQVEEMRERPYE